MKAATEHYNGVHIIKQIGLNNLLHLSYLLTALASAGEKLNFSMKKTLGKKTKRQDDGSEYRGLLSRYVDVNTGDEKSS